MATGLGSPQGFNLALDLNPLSIIDEPSSQTVVAGQTASFTVSAVGTPTPTVQWQVSTDGGVAFSTIPGATSDTYSVVTTAAENGDEYDAVVTNSEGSLTSVPATLLVFGITTASLPAATPGQAYAFQLTAVGGTAPYTWTHTGALPHGLKLTSRGLITGTPKPKLAGANYPVTVMATTRKMKVVTRVTASQALSLTVQ
jgi:large repetitive protein